MASTRPARGVASLGSTETSGLGGSRTRAPLSLGRKAEGGGVGAEVWPGRCRSRIGDPGEWAVTRRRGPRGLVEARARRGVPFVPKRGGRPPLGVGLRCGR